MRDDVIRVVETYIGAVRNNKIDAIPVHPDVVFESPIRTIRGIANLRKGMEEFVPILRGIEVVRLTADNDSCAAALKVNTIFGLLPFLYLFEVVDGQIVSVRAYFDPRPILEGMNRMLG